MTAYKVDPILSAIKELMRQNGITTDNVAYSSGVSRSGIQQAFSGNSRPLIDNVRRLATALGYKIQLVPMSESEFKLACTGELEYNPIQVVSKTI